MLLRARKSWSLLVTVLLVGGLLAAGSVMPAAAQGRRSFEGKIGDAQYRVVVPDHWNGTLVLYSHGYFPPGTTEGIGLTNRQETEPWLLDHGYALAASDFTGRFGAVYDVGPRDQLALLDWFDANVGRPRRTVALGSSMGGALSIMLAERNPRRFDGVAALCPPVDLNGQWNSMLDVMFALKTLVVPPDQRDQVELVHVSNAQRTFDVLRDAIFGALRSPEGRARLALAGAIGNVPAWTTADKPRSPELGGQLEQLANLIFIIHDFTFGPFAHGDLERRAGGNPVWNVGVDYGRQLSRSSERSLVRAAYADAKLDVRADLAQLAAAPRIRPDLPALRWMYRFGVPRGVTPVPVVTMHNVADAAEPGHERWYAEQVRRSGNPDRLRQLYLDRPATVRSAPPRRSSSCRRCSPGSTPAGGRA